MPQTPINPFYLLCSVVTHYIQTVYANFGPVTPTYGKNFVKCSKERATLFPNYFLAIFPSEKANLRKKKHNIELDNS